MGLTDEDRAIIRAVRLAFEGEALNNSEAMILAGALCDAVRISYDISTTALKLEVEKGEMGFDEWDKSISAVVSTGLLVSALEEAERVRKD